MTGEADVESSKVAGGEENSQARLSPSDIATKHLEAAGFTGRAGDRLGSFLGSTNAQNTATKILSGEPLILNTTDHRKQIAYVLGKMDNNTANLVTGNIEPWRGFGESQYTAFMHAISGEVTELVSDTQVAYLIDSIKLVLVLKVAVDKTNQRGVDVSSFRPRLNEFVTRIIGKKSWEEIAAVAKEYTQSLLAGEIHQAAQTLQEKTFMEFLGATDPLLSEYAVLQNPQGFIQATRATYKEAYGLDLSTVRAIERDSPEGIAFLRKRYEKERRAAEEAEATRAAQTTVDLPTTGVAPLDSKPIPVEEQQPNRDLSRWLLDNGRLNVVDGLTLEKLKSLAKELDLSIREGEQVSEGELRRRIAIEMLRLWRRQGETDESAREKIDEDFSPFFLICGRGNVGFAGITPEGLLGLHFQLYSFGNFKEKMRTINELYGQYWEDRKPEETIKH